MLFLILPSLSIHDRFATGGAMERPRALLQLYNPSEVPNTSQTALNVWKLLSLKWKDLQANSHN